MQADTQIEKNFCFCTLALRSKYRLLAQQLAQDLLKYAPGVTLVLGTDQPSDFQNCQNVVAFKLEQQGILHCYHDKRFVLQQALARFSTAIQIDADTRIVAPIPDTIIWEPGIAALHIANLFHHVETYNPERLNALRKIASKLCLSLEGATYVGESLFAVSADPAAATEFLKQWNAIAQYLELHNIHSGEGNAIGLAAAKAGFKITRNSGLDQIHQARKHMDASETRQQPNFGQKLGRKFKYHYRLNRARFLAALRDFDFYYR
jgi:hypothetical protein